MITRRQIRTVLAGAGRLVDPAGQPLGRMTDVVLDARTSQPVWVTLDCPECDVAEVVVPLARARVLEGCIQVPYTAAAVCSAPRGEVRAGRFEGSLEDDLRVYYALVDATAPAWPDAPPADADPDVLPTVVGLDVRTGVEAPVVYPATPSGPWPAVDSSSAGPPWWQRRQWRRPSLLTSVRAMRVDLRPVLELTGLPDDELDDLVLAAGEAATNAVEHARFPALPFFDVSIEVGEHRACVVIQDHGRWRTPSAGGDRGRGLQMIGQLADATLTVGPRGTTVVLRNRLGAAE